MKKTIDFQAKNLTVNEALLKLSSETGIDIAYSPDFIKNAPKLTVRFQQAPVKKILTEIISKTHLQYKTIGKRILLYPVKKKMFTLNGYMEDAESGERLISARIYCPKIRKGCVSNDYGFFSLSLEEGVHDIEFHYVGFKTVKKRIHLKENIHERITLTPNLSLPAVVISPKHLKSKIATEDSDKSIHINTAFVKASPALGGESDHLRAAQMLPGVQGGIDGLGGLHVRGGENGQNLMLMDGVPVYIPYHMLGAYSIYNSSMVRSAKVMKGNFSARYGGRLSSVFDIRTREGNLHKWEGETSINLINAKVLLEGPIRKGKGSFLISARLAPADVLLSPVLERIYFQKNDGNLNTGFADLNVKVNYAVSKKDRLYLSYFSGTDGFEKSFSFSQEDSSASSELFFTWQNSIKALRWNHLFNAKLFANMTLTHSKYDYIFSSLDQYFSDTLPGGSPAEDFYFLDSRSKNTDLGIAVDFDYIPNTKHAFKFGLGLTGRNFSPDLTYYDNGYIEFTDIDTVNIGSFNEFLESSFYYATEANFYIEDRIKINDRWETQLGVRGSAFYTGFKTYKNLEPRAQVYYTASEKLRFNASANRMVQYLHLISNSSIRLPNDIWLPSTENLKPQESWQAEIGARYSLTREISLGSDMYVKKMNNLYAYPDGFTFLKDINDGKPEDYVVPGKGHAYGLELTFNYEQARRGLMFSYVLSKSVRQYTGQNLELSYPHEYDARHQVKFFAYQHLGKRFQVSMNWVFNSPNPRLTLRTLSTGQGLRSIDLNPEGKKNFTRAKAYHRLDLNASYKITSKKNEQLIKLGLYNAYNQRNIAYYELVFSSSGEREGRPVLSIPLLPSFSYSVRF